MTDWRAACAHFAQRHRTLPGTLRLLDAFGRPGDDPRAGADFDALEAAARRDAPALPSAIVAALGSEVDCDQAALFARRAAAAWALLDGLAPDPTARVLRVGLACRLRDVLAASPPRALRVRAVVDFYTSQAALVRHRHAGGPALDHRLATLDWVDVAAGLRHARLSGPTDQGPVSANLLTVAPGCRLRTRDARGCGDVGAWVEAQGAAAATSGGFFLYSEADIEPPSARRDPVGLLVEGGAVTVPPLLRRTTLAQGRDGEARICRLGPEDAELVLDCGARLRPVATNAPSALAALIPRPDVIPVVAFNRAFGAISPPHAGRSVAVVGARIGSVGAGALPIPLHGAVLALPPGVTVAARRGRWHLRDPLTAAMAGGPRLLRDGRVDLDRAADDLAGTAPPVTFSQDETYDQNRLPRLGVGRRPDGTLVFAAIDGRDVERAPGFTLGGLARLLAAVGCTDAVNLDGGSSKRMVVAGRVVDRPSTEVGGADGVSVRPVHTAVLIYARGVSPRGGGR